MNDIGKGLIRLRDELRATGNYYKEIEVAFDAAWSEYLDNFGGGEEDNHVQMNLDLDDRVLLDLAHIAHRNNETLNGAIVRALKAVISKDNEPLKENRNFKQLLDDQEVSTDQIDDYIEEWHSSYDSCDVHEYLGMTVDEYSKFVRDPDTLKASPRRVPASGKEPEQEGSTPTDKKLPDGQYADHWVLSEEERANGYVEPVRYNYKHEICGGVTRMGHLIAATYAADPSFYGSTFCATCNNYYPVGANGEFVWDGTNQKVGTRRNIA